MWAFEAFQRKLFVEKALAVSSAKLVMNVPLKQLGTLNSLQQFENDESLFTMAMRALAHRLKSVAFRPAKR